MMIKVKKDPKSKEFYLDINDFKNIIDISRVKYYQLKETEKNHLVIEFFDNEKNKIIPINKK